MFPWYFYAFGSAIFATLFVLLRKKSTLKEHALEFEMTRNTFTALFCFLLIPLLSFKYSLKSILAIYFLSIIATIGILLFTKALRHGDISEIVPLSNLKPGFLAILAVFFLNETLTKPQMGGIALLVFGSYVLEVDHRSLVKSLINNLKSKYVIYVLAATLIFSFTNLLDKYVVSNLAQPFDFLFLARIFIALNFIAISSIKYDGLKGIKNSLKINKHYVVLASLFNFLAMAFYIYAISVAFVYLVVPIASLSTLMSTIIGGELFHEKALFRKGVACLIMIVGAYLIII